MKQVVISGTDLMRQPHPVCLLEHLAFHLFGLVGTVYSLVLWDRYECLRPVYGCVDGKVGCLQWHGHGDRGNNNVWYQTKAQTWNLLHLRLECKV